MAGASDSVPRSSILRKQVVALTGILLVGYVVMHLAGNTLLFAGPTTFNHYAQKLHDLGPLLWVARIVLLVGFLVHVVLTVQLTLENRAARGGKYAVSASKTDNTFAKKSMIYTGVPIFLFLLLHISDFTLGDHHGDPSVVAGVNDGESLGLFGLVWNGFLQPWRSGVYIVSVILVGLHLSHGVQSLFQSLGFSHAVWTPRIRTISLVLGAIVAIGFGSIPIYVLIARTPGV